jgi:hypothetical protein
LSVPDDADDADDEYAALVENIDDDDASGGAAAPVRTTDLEWKLPRANKLAAAVAGVPLGLALARTREDTGEPAPENDRGLPRPAAISSRRAVAEEYMLMLLVMTTTFAEGVVKLLLVPL